jgi:hypothetical protein
MPTERVESHALVWYSCACGARLRAWNFRTNSAPVSIRCSSCGGMMHHCPRGTNHLTRNHKPWPGQLIIIDMPEWKARELTRRNFESLGVAPTEESFEALFNSIYCGGNSPYVTYFGHKEIRADEQEQVGS